MESLPSSSIPVFWLCLVGESQCVLSHSPVCSVDLKADSSGQQEAAWIPLNIVTLPAKINTSEILGKLHNGH